MTIRTIRRLILLVALSGASSLALAQGTTPVLHMQLPAVGQLNWGPIYNSNLSTIDAAIGSLREQIGASGQFFLLNPPTNATQTVTNTSGATYFTNTNCNQSPAGGQLAGECAYDKYTLSLPYPGSASGYGKQLGRYVSSLTWGPGNDNGTNGLASTNWSIYVEYATSSIFQRRGIVGGINMLNYKYSDGDMNSLYSYNWCAGSPSGGSDEGCTQIASEGGELGSYFHGTVSGNGGVGATQPTLAFVSGDNHTIDERILIDLSQGTISGNYTGVGNGTISGLSFVKTLPVSNTLPISSAFGIAASAINVDTLPNNPVSVVVPVTLQTFNSSTPAFTAGGTVCVANGNYAEQAAITAVSTPSGGVQNLTVTLREGYGTGTAFFQGSTCGQYLSFDADYAGTGFHDTYYTFGSLDGTNLIYASSVWGLEIFGFPTVLPAVGYQFAASMGGYHLYPGAEIVENTAIGFAPMLEANSVNWTVGDTVENPHGAAFEQTGLRLQQNQVTPTNPSLGGSTLNLDFTGPGENPSFIAINVNNQQTCTGVYIACGGPIGAPQLMNVSGRFTNLLTFQYGPSPSGPSSNNTVIAIDSTAAGGSDNTRFNLFSLPYNGNTSVKTITYNPATGNTLFPGLVDTNLSTSSQPLCTNGTSGAFSNTGCGSLAISVTTTSATFDVFTLTGMTSSGHCSQPGATNSSASTATGTYISAKATNSVTLTHSATAGMTFDIICTPY